MKEKKKETLSIFYLYSFFSYLYMFSPLWVIFLLQNNFTMVEIGIIDAIYWLSLFIFQIPAGLLSDRYPRVYIMAGSSFLVGIAAIIFAFPISFWLIVLSYVIWAGGIALKNVGDAAWLFDYMHSRKAEQEFTKTYGSGWALSEISVGIAAMLGGLFASLYGLQYPILLSGVIIFLSGLLPLRLPCMGGVKREDVIENLKQSVKLLKAKHSLYLLLFAGGIYAALDSVFIILKQPFMYSIGIPIEQIGLIYLLFTFVGALASFSMHKIEKVMGRTILLLISMLPIASLFLLLFSPGTLAVSGVILFSFTTGLTMPLIVYYINLEIPSDKRGVMLSYMSAIYTAILIPLSPICGFLADISLTIAIASLFWLCIPLLVLLLIAYKKT